MFGITVRRDGGPHVLQGAIVGQNLLGDADGAPGREVVRPDLFVAVAAGDFEHHWFVELDMGTETIGRRLTKCAQYEAYYRSGSEQAAHDLFPRVVWAVPNDRLADELQARIHHARRLTRDLFAVATHNELLAMICGGSP